MCESCVSVPRAGSRRRKFLKKKLMCMEAGRMRSWVI